MDTFAIVLACIGLVALLRPHIDRFAEDIVLLFSDRK